MEDVQNRLSKARGTYVRLIKIWNSRSISRRTKMKLYKTLVLPVLMYGCETWKMTKSDEHVLNVFQTNASGRFTAYVGKITSPPKSY